MQVAILDNQTRMQAFRLGAVSFATSLDLSGNRLRSFCRRDFRFMTKLRHLNLEGNRVATIVADYFFGLSSLRELNLNNNGLQVTVFANEEI